MKSNLNKLINIFKYLGKKHPILCIWILFVIVLLFMSPRAAGSLFICGGILMLIVSVLRPILRKSAIRIKINKK